MPTGFTDRKPVFSNFSKFGLNVGSKLSDEFKVAAQFVVSGNRSLVGSNYPEWALVANWAFVTYTPVKGLNFKLGRQLYPVWIAAEFIDVNYLQPFREMPNSVYSLSPFKGFDGLSVDYGFDLGFGTLTPAMFGGRANLSSGSAAQSIQVDSSNLLGASLTLDGDGYRLRAQTSRSDVRINQTITAAGINRTMSDATIISTVGYRFDKYNIVSWGEYGYSHAPKGQDTGYANVFKPALGGKYLGDIRSWYLLGGYRFGNIMPRYTYAKADWQAGIVNGKSKTHNFGVNIQATPGVMVKLDYEIVKVPGPTENDAALFVTRTAGSTETTAKSFFAGVDFIF